MRMERRRERRSREGAWIEIPHIQSAGVIPSVAPARERGLKFDDRLRGKLDNPVAPARERGLKSAPLLPRVLGRFVAPARERGLKFIAVRPLFARIERRSREGAWIEIRFSIRLSNVFSLSLPRGSVD